MIRERAAECEYRPGRSSERDVRDYKVDALLQNFSTVFQGVFLFDDTVRDNIKSGNPDATHEQVVDAARRACCERVYQALPDGYETRLGEGGFDAFGGGIANVFLCARYLKDA